MIEQIEKILGYSFKNKKLLEQAFTHTSITNDLSKNYERLEFLGDRVLGMAVSLMLLEAFPDEPEGNLAQRFVALVCKETVAEVSLRLGLEKFIKAEAIDVKSNENVLCDVGEAIIGAICLDSNQQNAVEFVEKNWSSLLNTHKQPPKDSKTRLQELAHEKSLPAPQYSLVERTGSEHEPIFVMQVSIQGHKSQVGRGKNKKLAEQEAAKNMINVIGDN